MGIASSTDRSTTGQDRLPGWGSPAWDPSPGRPFAIIVSGRFRHENIRRVEIVGFLCSAPSSDMPFSMIIKVYSPPQQVIHNNYHK